MTPPESERHAKASRRPTRRHGRACLWLALAFACAGPLAPVEAAGAKAETEQKLKAGSRDLDAVREKITAANQRIDRARADQGAQRAAVEKAERKIAESQAALKQLAADTEAQAARVRAAEDSRAAADRRLDEARGRLARQVRSAYVAGQGGTTALLLSQEEPGRIARLLTYFDYLNRASARQVDGIKAELTAVEDEQQKLDTELAGLKRVQAERQQALALLEGDRASRRKAIAALDAKIAGDDGQLKALRGSEQELQALLRQLKEALAAVPPPVRKVPRSEGGGKSSRKTPPKMRGVLSWPLRGAILADFGDAKVDGRLQWKGLWIAASEGAAVRASAPGRVAYVGWLSSYGLIVVVEHERGFFTLYGHNASVNAAAGDQVETGEIIAAVGNTGGYERSGLYFEVRRGTEPVDPRDWLGP
jgi:septal ring factor EnvC (AmiA/AmiB activator)